VVPADRERGESSHYIRQEVSHSGGLAPDHRVHSEEIEAVGTVEFFSAEEGWGAVVSEAMDGNAFVHFSMIEMEGFRTMKPGQAVEFRYLPERGQGGCRHQATWVRTV
jgi:cold shock protein